MKAVVLALLTLSSLPAFANKDVSIFKTPESIASFFEGPTFNVNLKDPHCLRDVLDSIPHKVKTSMGSKLSEVSVFRSRDPNGIWYYHIDLEYDGSTSSASKGGNTLKSCELNERTQSLYQN